MGKFLVIGLGKSGQAASELLRSEGHHVIGFDDKMPIPDLDLAPFDGVVVSPGVPPTHRYYQMALEQGKAIIGEAELAFSRMHQPAVAITGTNGKTTVTLMVEHILNRCGRKARALGNVGTPLTSYLKESKPDEIVVAELSSYQLETLKSRMFASGIILNITPDHLDRYPSMEAYAQAKFRLQELIKPMGSFWVHQTVADEYGSLLRDYQTYGASSRSTYWTDRSAIFKGEKIETVLPMRYRELGKHESENVLAAWLMCQTFEVQGEEFTEAVESFKNPAHRLEYVTTLQGVRYFNDSKGTNIDATIKAVETMQGKVVLIVGGVDKGASYSPWKECFRGRVKQVIAIGEAANKIARDLQPEFDVVQKESLQSAVDYASQRAREGETVLLSPGCASFDMFRDYAHRGEEFKKFILEKEIK